MATRMPTNVPLMTDDNIGRIKSDFDPPPDLDHHIPASEYNAFRLEFLAACEALVALRLGGATGTLQQAYLNSVVNPTLINLAAGQGRVIVRDTAGGLGGVLWGAARSDGTFEHGMARDGYQLADTPKGLYSPTAVTWQAMSGQAAVTGPAYKLDTEQDYRGDIHTRWQQLGAIVAQLIVGTSLGDPTEFQLWDGGGALLGRFLAESGQMRLKGLAGGIHFVPGAAGEGALGTAGEPWAAAHAYYFRGRAFTVPYNAALTIDASQGELATVTLTGDVATLSIGNFGAGQRLAIRFVQDGVGGRVLTPAGLIPAIKLTRGVPFTLSPAAGAEDILYLYSDGTSYHEVARKQARPPEFRVKSLSLAGPPDITIVPHIDEHNWVFTGTLNAAVTVNLSRTHAKEGDRISLEFDEVAGLKTDQPLTIQENGAGSLKVYSTAGNFIRGQVSALFNGTAWVLNIGGALSYA